MKTSPLLFILVCGFSMFASCYDYEDPKQESGTGNDDTIQNPSIKIDTIWKGEKFYDFNGNLLFTITEKGDTIWNT